MKVHLIGLGGAGKTTIGLHLASELGWSFYDLDDCFLHLVGDISTFIQCHGYRSYAIKNLELYHELIKIVKVPCVIACSSGFMVYPDDISKEYLYLKQKISHSPTTFVFFPYFEIESCVQEVLRRQLGRVYLNVNAQSEEAKIRKRFPVYMALCCQKILTSESCDVVAMRLAAKICTMKKQ
ncbi:hypothetical protein GCM10023206_16030 [Acinetobacter puyangensis]|uniref:Shikimate kinase n=1 Tax=Acinetobacter puyangensis TaxID=1096779 RepID=A0A240E8Y1_9GAMM|nr:shikimate kinase [Acinetobacter puyangensis]SNX44679.1 shikimate kinase [Acinetobacter puyangensis]